jgi:hypothetical protein
MFIYTMEIFFPKFLCLVILLSFLLILTFGGSGDHDRDRDPKLIVLLGASIGRAWDVPQLPDRMATDEYIFEYYGSSFDKTNKLRLVLDREENRPDAVIIKECAAYFPGNMDLYKTKMKKWIAECRKEGVIPIPATVVPVTRLHSYKVFAGYMLKGRNPLKFGSPFKPNRNNAICRFNDWIREYCKEQGLVYLDLEASLCYGKENRYLREDLARLDGLHINSKAYDILDRAVIEALDSVDWDIP